MHRALAVVTVLTVTSCGGGDGPTGPAGPVNPLSGSWNMSFANMTDGSITCFTDDFTVTLAQNGSTFTGGFGAITITCTDGTNSVTDTSTGGDIVNGSISGTTVSFDLDTPDLHQTGTLTLPTMVGTARWDLGSTVLNGNWTASRISP